MRKQVADAFRVVQDNPSSPKCADVGVVRAVWQLTLFDAAYNLTGMGDRTRKKATA
ncbi:MAG: hypothetical protein IPK72_11885 [Candidatus Eisenbacteria bacterium]|nr:hypothetical protein [Candidatus Eisenbacteria bacterium]